METTTKTYEVTFEILRPMAFVHYIEADSPEEAERMANVLGYYEGHSYEGDDEIVAVNVEAVEL